MFCTKCGAQVGENDKFCPECGAKIEWQAAPEPAPIREPEPEPEPKKKSHKALWITLTCVALAIVAAVAICVFWHPWSRNVVPETPVTETTPAPVPTQEPTEPKPEPLSPEEMIREAFLKLSETDSLHMDLSEEISITVGIPAISYSQGMDIAIILGCDSDKTNGTSRIEGSVSAMGFDQEVLAYAETIDGKVITYSSNDGGITWTTQDQSAAEDNSILTDPTQAVDLWMNRAKDLEQTGSEQVNGVETTVFTGKLSGEYVKDVAGMTGDMLGGLDEAMLSGLDDLPVTFWIDKESGCVVRLALDMQDMMKTLMENAMRDSLGEMPEGMDLSVEVPKALVICDLSQFNAIAPIVIPDEARGLAPAPEPEPEPEPESIIGTWALYGGEDEETQQYVDLMIGMGMDMIFVFNEDGTGSMSMTFQGEEDKEEFTYTLENGEIVIDGSGAPYRIEDGLLYLTADEVKLIFKRK